mmetsp:Transcript_2198/g.6741  ORF Transcript_2198/g.6741 Transcript_2198/m.6741 type:complete len:228 (-) Transcript_2198:54-737(-)
MKRRISGGNISPEFIVVRVLFLLVVVVVVVDPKSVLSSSQALSQQIDKMRRKLVEIHSYVLFSFQAKIKLLFVHFHRVAEKRIFLRLHVHSQHSAFRARRRRRSEQYPHRRNFHSLHLLFLHRVHRRRRVVVVVLRRLLRNRRRLASSKVFFLVLMMESPNRDRYRLVKQHLRRVQIAHRIPRFVRPAFHHERSAHRGHIWPLWSSSWRRRRVDKVLSRHIVVSTLL